MLALALVGIIVASSLGVMLYASQTPPKTTTTTLPTLTGTPTLTTLEDLAAGRFPTAYDRSGTGGVLVTVKGLTVVSVENESDGDWHVKVTDGLLPSIITEVTPAYQTLLGRPSAGQVIDETGTAFCDVQHENESWHGSTCWEIHPITSWSVAAPGSAVLGPTMTGGLGIAVGYSSRIITSGSNQTVSVTVSNGSAPVGGAHVSISVTNSGGDSGDLSCTTNLAGNCSATLPQAADGLIDTYGVKVSVGQTVFYSAFEVIGPTD